MKFELYQEGNNIVCVCGEYRRETPFAELLEIRDLPEFVDSIFDREIYNHLPLRPENIGRELMDKVFGETGKAAYVKTLGAQKKAEVIIRSLPEEYLFDAIPWEILHDGEDFLSSRPEVVFRRTVPNSKAVKRKKRIAGPLKMLFCFAEPKNQGNILIDQEIHALAPILNNLRKNGLVEIDEIYHADRQTLAEAFERGPFDLIFFSGHGTIHDKKSVLIVEKPDGTSEYTTLSDFRHWLGETPPLLMILNSCHGSAPVKEEEITTNPFNDLARSLVHSGVGCVTAYNSAVGAKGAIQLISEFLKHFFKACPDSAEYSFHPIPAAQTARHEYSHFLKGLPKDYRRFLAHEALRFQLYLPEIPTEAENTEKENIPLEELLLLPGDQTKKNTIRDEADKFTEASFDEVPRTRLIHQLESKLKTGSNYFALIGPGGLGKTVTARNFAERCLNHPVNHPLKRESVFWVTLTSLENSDAETIRHRLLEIAGMSFQEKIHFEQQVIELLGGNPSPKKEAEIFAEVLKPKVGERHLWVLDNAESLELCSDNSLREDTILFLETLVKKIGGPVLFTSRLKVSFENHSVAELQISPLDKLQAVLLLDIHKQQVNPFLQDYPNWKPAELESALIERVTPHPIVFRFFRENLDPGNLPDDPMEFLNSLNLQAANYAALDVYWKNLTANEQKLLQIFGLIGDTMHPFLFVDYLMNLLKWDRKVLENTIQGLARKGFIISNDRDLGAIPMVTAYVGKNHNDKKLKRECLEYLFAASRFFGRENKELSEEIKQRVRYLIPACLKIAFRLAMDLEEHETAVRIITTIREEYLGKYDHSALRRMALSLIAQSAERPDIAVDAVTCLLDIRCFTDAERGYKDLIPQLNHPDRHHWLGTTYAYFVYPFPYFAYKLEEFILRKHIPRQSPKPDL